MSFCTKCGANVPDGAGFCTNCGQAVSAAPAANYNQQVNSNQQTPFYNQQVNSNQQTPFYNQQANNQNTANNYGTDYSQPSGSQQNVSYQQSAPSSYADNGAYNYAYSAPGSQYSASVEKSQKNIPALVASIALIVLSLLVFITPYGGAFKYALKLAGEDAPALFVRIIAPATTIVMGDAVGIGSGAFACITGFAAMLVGAATGIMLIIYAISEAKGKGKRVLAKVAIIMLLVVTILNIGGISAFRRDFADRLLEEADVDNYSYNAEYIDDIMEEYLEDIGLTEEELEDEDNAEEIIEKVANNMITPSIYNYLIVIVSIAGIVVTRKKQIVSNF